MIKTLILEKPSVLSRYRYFDLFRYSRNDNLIHACKHYLNTTNRKYNVKSYQVVNVIEFKYTLHVKYEV